MALVKLTCTYCQQNTTVLDVDVDKRDCPNCQMPLGHPEMPRRVLAALLILYTLVLLVGWATHTTFTTP